MLMTYLAIFLLLACVYFRERKRYFNLSMEIQLLAHQDVLSTTLVLADSFEDKYPEFFKILKTFDGVELFKVLKNPSSVRKVPVKEMELLKKEMENIVLSGTDQDKILLGWYMVTCDILEEVYRKRSIESKEETLNVNISESRKVSKTDIDALDEALCYS